MINNLDWQRLQVSMNNFQIDKLMSYTDIQSKLKLAMNKTNKSDDKYESVQKIAKLIKSLGQRDDFIKDNKHNQQLFSQIHEQMVNLIGKVKVEDPTTTKLNHLFQQAKQKEPATMKKFNLRAHKQEHLSAQQAMLNAMGVETKAINSKH